MPTTDYRRKRGAQGEQLAVNHLRRQGYQIVERNFSCKLGEVDIIAVKDEYLVFCEVKSRMSADFGGAIAAVNYNKQQKLVRLANYYYHFRGEHSKKTCRFDVIAVQYHADGKPEIVHLENAFGW